MAITKSNALVVALALAIGAPKYFANAFGGHSSDCCDCPPEQKGTLAIEKVYEPFDEDEVWEPNADSPNQIYWGTCAETWTCGNEEQSGCPSEPCDDKSKPWCVSAEDSTKWFYCAFTSGDNLKITWDLALPPRPDAWVGFFPRGKMTAPCSQSNLSAPYDTCPGKDDEEKWYYACDGAYTAGTPPVEVQNVYYQDCPSVPAPKSASVVYQNSDVPLGGAAEVSEYFDVVLFGDDSNFAPLATAPFQTFEFQTFCFLAATPVVMADGAPKAMADVAVGDRLWGGAKVTGTQSFAAEGAALVDVAGVVSTAAHKILHAGAFKNSGGVPGAKPYRAGVDYVYDLETSDHRIVILNDKGEHAVYADFTEVPDASGAVERYELGLLNTPSAALAALLAARS